MSVWVECDRCNKMAMSNSGDERYEIIVNGLSGRTTLHLCEQCLKSFCLDFLESERIESEDTDMSKYREPSVPHDVSFKEIECVKKLLETKKLTDKQKKAVQSLLDYYYSKD